jgi:hypothetical protein
VSDRTDPLSAAARLLNAPHQPLDGFVAMLQPSTAKALVLAVLRAAPGAIDRNAAVALLPHALKQAGRRLGDYYPPGVPGHVPGCDVLDAQALGRCPECGHLWTSHDANPDDGCLYGWGNGSPVGCRCKRGAPAGVRPDVALEDPERPS